MNNKGIKTKSYYIILVFIIFTVRFILCFAQTDQSYRLGNEYPISTFYTSSLSEVSTYTNKINNFSQSKTSYFRDIGNYGQQFGYGASSQPLPKHYIASQVSGSNLSYPISSYTITTFTQSLERFGESFFKKGEDVLMFWHTSAIPPTYMLGPGDVLKIIVWSSLGNETVYDVVVNPEGQVYIPILGILGVGGLTLEQFQQTVLGALAAKFPHFKGQVTLTKVRNIQIYVVGEVRRPGAMILPAISTSFNALYRAGGPTEIGSYRKIKVIRNNKTLTIIDLYNYFTKGDNSSDIYLEDGDTIFVPPTSNLVTVRGEVVRPAIYEILNEQSLSDLIVLAGGLKPTAYTTRIKVFRWFGNDKRKIYDVELSKDISALANFRIASGDEIEVEPTINILANSVTIKGAVLRPGEYAISENTRLNDIIYKAGGIASEANTSIAHIIRQLPQQKEEIITINLDEALNNNSEHNILLKPSDTIIIYFSKEIAPSNEFVKILGAVKKPGEYRYRNKMTIRDLVLLANGLTLDACEDAEIASISPDGRHYVKKVKIKEVINNPKHSENFILQPLDVVTVKANQKLRLQPKIIELRGEVNFPGPYIFLSENEDINSIISRAGGLTQNAYLEGAYILRIYEKTFSKYQEEMLNSVIKKEKDILQINLLQHGISTSPTLLTDKFSYPFIQEATQKNALSNELSKYHIYDYNLSEKYIKIPLSFKNNKPLHEQSIQSGDIIVIPPKLPIVSVLGAVMHSTTLQYIPNKSASYYIKLAGGFSDFSNHRKAIIIRINGDVIPMHKAKNINPGDIIYIPYKVRTIKPDKLKEIAQVVSILGNLAVTYKAIKE